eukprot:jgi/Botrbrau1/1832/Bobra.146_1s0027.1
MPKWWPLLSLALVHIIVSFVYSQPVGSPSYAWQGTAPEFLIPDVVDSTSQLSQLTSQIFPAKVTDTFPVAPMSDGALSRWLPTMTPRKLKVCEKAAISECMPPRNSSNGASDNIQGIWWADGLRDPALAFDYSAAGYDPKTRKLIVPTFADGLVAYEATNSTWQGSSWSSSGAAFYNAILFSQLVYHVFFNEDFTFGQVIPNRSFGDSLVSLPVWMFDLTMEWMGQDTWKRYSVLLSIFENSGGDYMLRRIVNRDGSRADWFDKGWLDYKGDTPVAVGAPASPLL